MSAITHRTMTVSSWDGNAIALAHGKAIDLFGPLVTPITCGLVNGYSSFAVMPTGSKVGRWPEHVKHNEGMAKMVEWLDLLNLDIVMKVSTGPFEQGFKDMGHR